MALFRRNKVAATDPNVGTWGFWRWWQAEGAAQLADSLAGEDLAGVKQKITSRVAGIDPRLTWSVAPGVRAKHRLVVSGNGDPNVLLTARRWLRKAPEEDRVWEYRDQRPAMENVAGLTLSVDGLAIEPDEVTVAWAKRGYWVDVRVHHPLFGQQPDVIRIQHLHAGSRCRLGGAGRRPVDRPGRIATRRIGFEGARLRRATSRSRTEGRVHRPDRQTCLDEFQRVVQRPPGDCLSAGQARRRCSLHNLITICGSSSPLSI